MHTAPHVTDAISETWSPGQEGMEQDEARTHSTKAKTYAAANIAQDVL